MSELRAYQPSFTAGELSPALGARVDLAKYSSGLRKAKNVFVHAHGGVSNRPGLQFIDEVKNSGNKARLIGFEFNTEQSYILEFGHQYFRVYKDGGIIIKSGSPYEVATPYTQDQVRELVFAQEADVMYIVHPDHQIRKLARLAEDDWTLTTVTFGPKISPPSIINVTKPGDTSGEEDYEPKTYRYRVAAVDDATGEESLPGPIGQVTNDLALHGGRNRVSWSAVTGAGRYIVYKDDNGVFGYIGGTSGLFFEDENIVADMSDTPQTARNPFSGSGNYPRCVSFIEQRLAFAGSKNDPQAVWMSQSASYENFGFSRPAKASDAVTFRIKARQVNEIRSMIPARGLMLLTSGAEWVVSGGTQSDAITPSALKVDNQGYRGAARVQPILVGNTVLFAQNRGGVVRDFSYQFTEDSFVGKDLTIMARHLFENRTIVAWAFAQAPNSIVWVVLDNGMLLSLTYMKEHDVWAWTQHESSGAFFEDVAVIAEGNEDVPYFIVRRTIGGAQKRYIERLHTRDFTNVNEAFFVDSGLSYHGSPVSTVSGLSHLNGERVVALADGNVLRDLLVSNGSVTLQISASTIHVGLPYEATVQTLDLDLGQVPRLGTVQGRMKSISEVVLRVENTRGIFVGPYDRDKDDPNMVEYKQRATEAWNEAIQLYTGDIIMTPQWDWNLHGSMCVKQFDPLPMTILAIMPNVTVGL